MEVTNPNENWNQPQASHQENKKIAAGVCALLIGGIGVHKFIL
jgi:TM2 domain-containing membrane protein YozV